jgi:Rho termination factor, N-terminal domain
MIMPGRKKPGPSVKDPKVYEDIREQGGSKQKAARIANAAAARGPSSVGKKGGKSGSYENWTVDELRKRAKELGLSGYSGKKKSELVSMLRNH